MSSPGLRSFAQQVMGMPELARVRESLQRQLKHTVSALNQMTAYSEREQPSAFSHKVDQFRELLNVADQEYLRIVQMTEMSASASGQWQLNIVGNHLRANFARAFGLVSIERDSLLVAQRKLGAILTDSKQATSKANNVAFISHLSDYYSVRSMLLDASTKPAGLLKAGSSDKVAQHTGEAKHTSGSHTEGLDTDGLSAQRPQGFELLPATAFVKQVMPIALATMDVIGDQEALKKQLGAFSTVVDVHHGRYPESFQSNCVALQSLLLFSHISEAAEQHAYAAEFTKSAMKIDEGNKRAERDANLSFQAGLTPLLMRRYSNLLGHSGRDNDADDVPSYDLHRPVQDLRQLAAKHAQPDTAIELRLSILLRCLAQDLLCEGAAVQAEGFLGGARNHVSTSISLADELHPLVEGVEEAILVEQVYSDLVSRMTINNNARDGDLLVSRRRSQVLQALVPDHKPPIPQDKDSDNTFRLPYSILSDLHRIIEQEVFDAEEDEKKRK